MTFTIIVPASSANIGPGFDSVGLAVDRYLTLHVQKDKSWKFEHEGGFLPNDINYEDHFIYQIAIKVAKMFNKELYPCNIYMKNEIPLARGLGSSSAAVIAGIELANQLCDLKLTTDEKLHFATEYEGHPDNVAPALLGGLVVSSYANQEVDYIKINELDLDIVIYIPEVELKTDYARNVLPKEFSRDHAARASGVCNLLIASLLKKEYELAGKMMEADLFHEPYRAKLIPNYESIKSEAKKYGAYGTVISGAGPTMISFIKQGKGKELANQMSDLLPNYEVSTLKVDQKGLQVQ